jgi:hypothetical protein
MNGQKGVTWLLAASAFCLSACGSATDPNKDTASPAAGQQITLHVPGMTDRQGIT